MWKWLARLFGRDPETPPAGDEPPPWALDLLERIEGRLDDLPGEAPPWAEELKDLLQKTARGQGKSALRLEEIERKIEGGFLDLRQVLAAQAPARPPEELRYDDLLDALDLLEEARVSLAGTHPSAAAGLLGVIGRLHQHLGQSGLTRCAPLHEPADGTAFRVVGTEERADLPEGAVTRVVRAAVRRGGRLVRQGEVLTTRSPSP